MDIQDIGHCPPLVDLNDFMAEPHFAPETRGRQLSDHSETPYRYRESSYDRKAREQRTEDKLLDPPAQKFIYENALQEGEYKIVVIQQPGYALAYGNDNKLVRGKIVQQKKAVRPVAKYPLYPLPVIQFLTSDGKVHNLSNSNPNFIAYATLRPSQKNPRQDLDEDEQVGLRTCSLNRINVPPGHRDPFESVFAFADIHVRNAGDYYLKFDMFELVIDQNTGYSHAIHRCSVNSDDFTVYSKKAHLPVTQPITALTNRLHESGFKTNPRRMPMARKTPEHDFSSSIAQERKSSGTSPRSLPKKKGGPTGRNINTLAMTHQPHVMVPGDMPGTIGYTNNFSSGFFGPAGNMNLPIPQGLELSQSVMSHQPHSYGLMQNLSGAQHGLMPGHYQNRAQNYGGASGMTMTHAQAAAVLNVPTQSVQGHLDVATLAQGSAQEAMNWTRTHGQGYHGYPQPGEIITNEEAFPDDLWNPGQASSYQDNPFDGQRLQHDAAVTFGYFGNTQQI